MVKPEWGTKRVCQKCGDRFYDLMRSPIICPKCGASVDLEAMFRSRRPASQEKAPIPAESARKVEVDDDDVELALLDDDGLDDDLDDSESDDLIEDASDLGGDDEDMAEVIDHLDEKHKDDL